MNFGIHSSFVLVKANTFLPEILNLNSSCMILARNFFIFFSLHLTSEDHYLILAGSFCH